MQFKKQFRLEGKPIVYLGNCQRIKGVVEAYEHLKDMEVHPCDQWTKRGESPGLKFEFGL